MSPRAAVNTFFFINGFIFANWASRIPRLQEDYGMNNIDLGYMLLAHSIGAFIAMPVTGWLIHHYGSKSVTFWSGFLFTIIFCLLPFSLSLTILFIPFFLMGASTGILDVAMNAQAVDVERELRKPVMTFFHALFSIGMVFGGLSGALFTRFDMDLQPHFIIVMVVSAVAVVYSKNYLLADKPISAEPDTAQKMFIIPKGPVIGLGFIAFCCMIGESAMSDWSTNYMKNIMLTSESFAAIGITSFAAAMTAGRLVGDRLRALHGDSKMLIFGSALSLLGMILLLSKLSTLMAIAGFAIIGLGLSNIVPIVYSLSGNLEGIPTGVGIAMATTIGYSGFMIGPPVIGFISERWDLHKAFFSIFILLVIMIGVVLHFRRTQKKAEIAEL